MRDYRCEPGTPINDLDTPCLIVEMDALENNYRVAAEAYRDTVCKMRQHTKNVKSPLLAKMQMEFGGSNGGVCTAKVAEAEVMIEGGITDILIPNQIVTHDKLARLCALAVRGDVKICADSVENVRAVSEAASRSGVEIGILIEVDTSMGRAGVRGKRGAVEVAKAARDLPGVAFRGVMSHQNVGDSFQKEERHARGRETIQICLDAKNAVEAAGIPVEIVSSGETFSYDVAAQIDGVTEVEGGTYALMSTGYAYMTEFQIAGKVLGTVVSAPRPGIVIGDVGTRAMAGPSGMIPSVDGLTGVEVESIHDEHIVLSVDGDAELSVGDKFKLLPAHQDMLVNRWDEYTAVRNGVVEEVWEIPARGCYH